jgi:hypothetical protein
VAEYMVVIGWQCKIILHYQCIQIKPFEKWAFI